MPNADFDVLVIGAGLSGIGAGYYLQTRCPTRTYAILEGRADLGGTWDLFRFPGVRSDSDMFTLGYSFRPWKEAKAIADGPAILKYLRETAAEFGIDRHIRFGHRVRSASWSTEHSRWTIEAEVGPERTPMQLTCRFLFLCSGYYDYEKGHAPTFPGSGTFEGPIVHPQFWPEDLDTRGKRIVVIGSGATAVTLVPALAETAAHVTMLQRSPTYIVPIPSRDPHADFIRRMLPERIAHRLIRWKNLFISMSFYRLCRRSPERAKKLIRKLLARQLPPDFDIDTHFKPAYEPWDQRVCFVPDGDLFRAIRTGRASVVTDQIETITHNGIRLQSGRELSADIIVTATGLKIITCGGIRLSVDGVHVDPGQCVAYKGTMLSNVPNCALCVGYTNASWTLRSELLAEWVCRLLNEMERLRYDQCVPRCEPTSMALHPLLELMSGYVKRGTNAMPKQGTKAPWIVRQNYVYDMLNLRYGSMRDRALKFSRRSRTRL